DGSFQTPDMNSYNHYAYGAIGDWMYRTIAGINSVADEPGYKAIVIAPKPNGKITSASAELETAYGTVKSSWTLENGLLKLEVTIPANSKAKVVLPDSTREIGSGTYYFESKI
ncbi:MAG: alpha-L-rhamnosidase C-terminal domain-containing protein, partial [Sphingobacterium sp.]